MNPKPELIVQKNLELKLWVCALSPRGRRQARRQLQVII